MGHHEQLQRRPRMPKKLWQILMETVTAWLDHEGPRLAASLSLYSLLSLAPLVILSIALASLAFGRSAAQHAVVSEIRRMMGEDGAQAIRSVIAYGKAPRADSLTSILGILTLLIGASSVFGELQSAMNKIWDEPGGTGNGIVGLIKSRLFSFAMVLGLGFLLLVSLLFSTALAAVGGYFSTHLSVPHWLLSAANELLSFVAISFLIGLILRYVPDTALRWGDVWEGAIATALLFTVGKALLGWYLGKAAVGSAYGAARSVIVVIVWIYYSAMIFYFGAEFTRIRSRGGGRAKRQTPKTGKSCCASPS
jgi:membrane protein